MKQRCLLVLTAIFLALSLTAFADEGRVEYVATNVEGNVWQYDYYLTGFNFSANQGFRIEFDWEKCGEIALPTGSYDTLLEMGWDVMALPTQPYAQDYGLYDAFALTENPDYTGPFSVLFSWTDDDSAPGAQGFSTYQWDDDGLAELSRGMTALQGGTPAPVPEPGSSLLLAGGLLALCGYFWKRKSTTLDKDRG